MTVPSHVRRTVFTIRKLFSMDFAVECLCHLLTKSVQIFYHFAELDTLQEYCVRLIGHAYL